MGCSPKYPNESGRTAIGSERIENTGLWCGQTGCKIVPPDEKMRSDYFSDDILEFLILLDKYSVRYLIVGGEAVIYYGYARLTGDVDIFYDPARPNITRLYEALSEFWDNDIPGIKDKNELTGPGYIIQFGVPPNRIDLMNTIDGVSFLEAWNEKRVEELKILEKSIPINFIGLKQLIANKVKSGRNKDLDDLKYLKSIDSGSKE